MFILPEAWLPAANYALARNATFSTNLDTKRRVYLERHGGDVTRVNMHSSKSPPYRSWYTIYYYVPPARKLVFTLQLRVA